MSSGESILGLDELNPSASADSKPVRWICNSFFEFS
jgi:hypothetical protein